MKKIFKFEDYQNNCVMHCKTKEEAIEFCKLMHEDGRTWTSKESYEEENYWETHKQRTCYAFNYGQFCNKEHYINDGYLVLEWEDFTTATRETIVYRLNGYDVEFALEEMRIDYTEEQLHNIIEYIDEHSLDIPWTEYMIPTIEMAIEEGVMGSIPFKPKLNEKYYYPSFSKFDLYEQGEWSNWINERNIRKTVGIYKTKEEAVAKAKELWGLNVNDL